MGQLKPQFKPIYIINQRKGAVMKKTIGALLLLFSLVFTLFNFSDTKAARQPEPCKYVLDLEHERCCDVGGNCCGPDNCR